MENGYIRPGGGKESFMDGLKKAYYRTYQQVFDIGMRCLHWRKPIVISGASCIRQVPEVLSKSGVTKVMVVTKLRMGDANTMMAEGGIQVARAEAVCRARGRRHALRGVQ
jgi:hypothetical protein